MKHLRLENILLPWSSQLLTGLETLSLGIEGTIPVEEIVNIFIKSPSLQSFRLSCRSAGGQDFPSLPTPASSNPVHVAANSLEDVDLCFDDPRIASHILSWVSMPTCRSVRLAFKSMGMTDDIHSLNVALSQFASKIGHVMSQVGRTKFYIWAKHRFEWSISSEQESFQFSLEFSGLPLESFIECARNVALASALPLELEVYLRTMPRWIGEELGGWSEIIKLHVDSTFQSYDQEDEVVLFPDYLVQTQMDQVPGLSWPFPNLRELDLSGLECPLLKVFDMLNRRYLPSSDVERMKDLDIPVNIPPKLDIRIRDALEWEDAVIMPALESH
ncbi:hypothetical protein M407DRAFT_22392 [Tulasnella calospora MUT 4182]|uniref:F-box domain-containing protein n=1 Tax=Tulasnella calospora MUT 4182 TaxID=1051891 RepID=A0A0C3QCM1_9AGAM|nr:hypothetical protein M407DRAFT_22392 [Tulasnella calospora MUT 4182]